METLRFIDARKDITERDEAVITYHRLKEQSAVRKAIKAEAEQLKLYRRQAIERRNEAFKQTIGDIKSDFKDFLNKLGDRFDNVRETLFKVSFFAFVAVASAAIIHSVYNIIFN